MKRALVLLIVSIGLFRRRPPGTSCAGSGCRAALDSRKGSKTRPTGTLRAFRSVLPQTRLRLRSRCAACIILMLICSGCGQKQAAPLNLNLPDCPAPAPPPLPLIDGSAPLDAPDNVARLMERDDRIRAYIDGLNATLRCFQAGRNHGNQ